MKTDETFSTHDAQYEHYHPKSALMDRSSSDLYPRALELQRRTASTSFVVATTSAALNAKTPINVILSSGNFAREFGEDKFVDHLAPLLALHVKRSPCPVYWQSQREQSVKFDMPRPAQKMDVAEAEQAGVAFPVHLGNRKTGITIFFNPSVTITRDMQIDFHRKIYQILRELIDMENKSVGRLSSMNIRETECLQHAGNGLTSEDIAELLGLSVHTVNAHLSSATSKLDSVNRIQAIAKAIRLGLIS